MVVWSRVWDGPELLEGERGTIHLCGVNAAARWIPFVCLSDDGNVLDRIFLRCCFFVFAPKRHAAW